MKINLVANQKSLFEDAINELIESEKIQQTIDFINSQYEENPCLQDGFARIGGIYREKKDWIAAEQWMRRDIELNRISPDRQLRYAEALLEVGKEPQALDLVEKVYATYPDLTDGYARLGWAKGHKTEWAKAQPLMQTDDNTGRMSPQWRLNYAQLKARCNDDVGAIAEVEKAYSLDSTLIDGYSKLGGIKREKRDWVGARNLIERDLTLARNSWDWQLRYAEVLLELGLESSAIKLVDEIYSQYPEATDGYARLGWARGRGNEIDWHECVILMERDFGAGRMTPPWYLHYAYSHMRAGNNERALELINHAYLLEPDIKDGFSRLGAYKFVVGDTTNARKFMDMDHELGRMSHKRILDYTAIVEATDCQDNTKSFIKETYNLHKKKFSRADLDIESMQIFAELAMLAGDDNSAEFLIDQAYSLSNSEINGYTRLGRIKLKQHKVMEACMLMAKDHVSNRMSPEWYPDFARIAAYCGATDKYGIGLRSQKEIIAKWDTSKPLISVICIAYNHEEYIEDALRGILIQETTYPFEIIIHDDASTDGTQEILKEYQSRYPDLIKLILQSQNQYSCGRNPSFFYREVMQGVYFALCEGDDYWILPDKLEKQASFLDNNPDFFSCIHGVTYHDESLGRKFNYSTYHGNCIFEQEDLLKRKFEGKWINLKAPSRMSRSYYLLPHETYEQSQVVARDLFSSSMFGLLGKCMSFSDYFGSVFRRNNSSSWHPLDDRKKHIERINTCYWLSQFYKRINRHDIAKYWAIEASNLLQASVD